MPATLKILHLEDSPRDGELVGRLLTREGFVPEIDRVSDRAGFAQGLEREGYAVILADHTIPDLAWWEALAQARRRRPEVPFLFVSGAADDGEVVAALQQGATDYVLKQHLERLGPAVRRALAAAAARARRRPAQAKARAHQALLRLQAAALQSAANGISITDRDGTILWVNPAFERLTGYPAGELLGQNHRLLKSGRHDPAFYRQMWDTLRAGRVWHGEIINQRKDGAFYHEEMTIAPVRDAAGEISHFVAIKQDVTAQRQAERALRHSEALYRSMARSIPQGALSVVDRDLRFLLAEGELLARLGLHKEELEGRTVPEVYEAEISRVRTECFRRALAGETVSTEIEYRGHSIWSQFVPLRDEHGEIVAAMSLALEITERQRAAQALRASEEALAKANQQLEHTVRQRTAKLQETLQELEHMSYSMMHDMRAPLRAIISFTQMLEEGCPGGNQDHFRRIKAASARMDRLLTDALAYNKLLREAVPLEPIELAGLLRSLLETYPDLQPAVADIRVEFKALGVLGNEALLTQCFGNLLSNAVKFVAPGVRPRVRLWAETLGPAPPSGAASERETPAQGPRATGHAPDAPLVRIWVEDNGLGIPPEAQADIFRMFQRLHHEQEIPGTGIGLTIVKKAVERMGGRVGLKSAPGRGSQFWVELAGLAPAQPQPPAP